MKDTILVCTLCLIPLFGCCQKVDFRLFTLQDGLASFKTSHVTQDQRGLIWMINDGQLFRYDGRKFLAFPLQKRMQADTIVEATGLWRFQDSLLLVEYDSSCYLSYDPERGNEEWLSELWERPQTLQDSLGNHPIHRYVAEGKLELKGFLREENKNIWAYGESGFDLMYYDHQRDTFYHFLEKLRKVLPVGFHFDGFKQISQDRTGTIWLSSDLGLLQVQRSENPFEVYFTEEDTRLINPNLNQFSSRMIYLLFPQGMGIIDPIKKKSYGPHSFGAQSQHNLPIGDTVWLWDGKYAAQSSGKVHDVPGSIDFGDEKFHVTMMTQDTAKRRWWIIDSSLKILSKSSSGYYWKKEQSLTRISKYMLHAGRYSGKLWISGRKGLTAYLPEKQQFERYTSTDLGFDFTIVNCVWEDKEEVLWLGTDKGLITYSPKEKTHQQYKMEEGLSDNFVLYILPEGDSCLWLSTHYGLSRFSKTTKSFINFHERDGLPDNRFNPLAGVQTADGNIFLGSQRKVVGFSPAAIMNSYRRQKKSDPPVLTAFEYVDERENSLIAQYHFAPIPSLDLYHWTKSFKLEFALPEYRDSEHVEYKYKLNKFEDRWSTPSRVNFVRYNSLPVGEYTLKVQARDSHGVWHPTKLHVNLRVHAPWWETIWAYIAFALILLLIAYGIYVFLKNRLLMQNQLKLERQEALRLKELDRFKSRFYTHITHEFRTPLTVILGMVDQIGQKPGRYLGEGLKLIERNGKNLLRLINQMLDLSRMENESFQLQFIQADIIPFLQYLTKSFDTFAVSKDISLHFSSAQDSLLMDHDPEQIKQVLSNLLSNAIKYTQNGGEVQVKVDREEKMLLIAVSDTGIGIPQTDIPFVFDRFYQVDNSTTRSAEGTGIGLAHTRELVKLMAGSIQVKSVVGEGSEFRLSLPIRNQSPQYLGPEAVFKTEMLEQVAPAKAIELAEQPQHKDLPVLLIVEDNVDVISYLRACLADQYAIEIAMNGQAGIEKAQALIPDIIISDVMMPEKNGYELCDTLKNDVLTSHIPIVLLTAKADVDSRLEGLRTGADAYLAKPFNKKELFIRMEKLRELREKLQARYAGGKVPQKPKPSLEDVFLHQIEEHILSHLSDSEFGNQALAQCMLMSESQLFRKLKALTGQSIAIHIRSIRLHQAKALLERTEMNVSEVAYEVGFNSPSYFSRTFSQEFGVPPTAIRP